MSETVQSMFASIAPRYDLTNTVLSLGIHHRWRQRVVKASGLTASKERGASLLDCATGTGDLAIAFRRELGHKARIVGTDFCAEMLEHAPAKAAGLGFGGIEFRQADVLNLPFDRASFDAASIAFGIRNVSDPVKGLREMARAVKPGGRVIVLEFGQPEGRLFGPLYRFYSNRVLPVLGGILTGNFAAYRYLNRTSAAFPSGQKFLDLMKETGSFRSVTAEPLTGGVAWIYTGVVA